MDESATSDRLQRDFYKKTIEWCFSKMQCLLNKCEKLTRGYTYGQRRLEEARVQTVTEYSSSGQTGESKQTEMEYRQKSWATQSVSNPC